MAFPPLRFKNETLYLLDQRKLPLREVWIACRTSEKVHWAIREMVVRGAPAIGIAGGYGLYLGVRPVRVNHQGEPASPAGGHMGSPLRKFMRELHRQAEYLKSARPTGVNLRNIIDGIVGRVLTSSSPHVKDSSFPHTFAEERQVLREKCSRKGAQCVFRRESKILDPRQKISGMTKESLRGNDVSIIRLKMSILHEARAAHAEDDRLCRTMGRHGAKLFRSGARVLTHCNAGGLATTGYGTALGVFYAMKEAGKKFSVYADETRPLLQGARLTAWELTKSNIPCTLLCDNMAASFMKAGKLDGVVVGADRIAANGDTANKIGTYSVAVLAKAHGIPFYVAAPGTTFDFKIKSGSQIPIEERAPGEVTEGFGRRTAPRKVRVANPAFDVTPHSLITAFITEAGVLRPPFGKSFRKIKII